MKTLILSTVIVCFICSPGQSQDSSIEQYVSYAGGIEYFYDYIKANLQYPKNALRDSITGDVFIEFVINSKGEVVQESVKVIKSLDPECDEEAVRLIKNSPRWIPARAEGKDVEQHVSFPVSFRLPE